ncbi:hypothetical protein [Cystobacter ferrugineus]|uniref:hypothetical protein n=1 Tax=Cystobacter ferrugineus TaxID=83449 RepID=UPI000A79629E|nr:hypothetical protein [Cystobacter ferrugineus]
MGITLMNTVRSMRLLWMLLVSGLASAQAPAPRAFAATYQGGSDAACDSTLAVRG